MSRSAVITASRPLRAPWFELSPPFYWSVTAVTDFASNMEVRDFAFIIIEFDWTCPRGGDTSRARSVGRWPSTVEQRRPPRLQDQHVSRVSVLPIGALVVLAYYLTFYLHANISRGSRRMRANAIQGGLDAIPGSVCRTGDGRDARNDLCPFDRRVGGGCRLRRRRRQQRGGGAFLFRLRAGH